MDWPTYKRLADTPGFWTRWMLEQCLDLLDQPHSGAAALAGVAAEIRLVLAGEPLPKPSEHRGPPAADLFELRLPIHQARAMCDMLSLAQQQGLRTKGTASRGLGGFAQAWAEYVASVRGGAERPVAGQLRHVPGLQQQLDSRQQGATMSDASAVVKRLIDGFNEIDLDKIIDCFADDAVYHNMPMEAVQGKDAIRASLEPFLGSASQVQWDLLSIAENSQGQVLTERVDKFLIGGKWLSVRVMGIHEVSAGKIDAWRDYFDLAEFQSQMSAD